MSTTEPATVTTQVGENRLALGRTLALGTGLLAVEMASGIYNVYVPGFLRVFITSVAVIGAITAFRTFLGLVLNVYFAARSDRTTRFGRRLPYIFVGMTLTAVLFAAFPWQFGAAFLLAVDLIYAFTSNIFYAPVVALMPDVTPPRFRSQANGIIYLMAGVGFLLATFVGPKLFHMDRHLPFAVVGIVFLCVPWLLRLVIREPREVASDVPSARGGLRPIWDAAVEVVGSSDRTALYLLLALLFVTLGEATVETLLSLYTTQYLHLDAGVAAVTLGIFALVYVLCAVPSGFLSARLGRKRFMVVAGCGLAAVFFALTFVTNVLDMRLLAAFGGLCWSIIEINAYPWLVDLTRDKVGSYTGLYLLFTGIGAIVGQPLIGAIIDSTSYPALFLSAGAACLVATVFLLLTRARHPATASAAPTG